MLPDTSAVFRDVLAHLPIVIACQTAVPCLRQGNPKPKAVVVPGWKNVKHTARRVGTMTASRL